MKILYISQYFYPEMGAPASRVHEMSREWVRNGHEVTVLTSFPNYPDGNVYHGYQCKIWRFVYKENIDGINVIRLWAFPSHLRSTLRRGLNYLSFFLTGALSVPFLGKYDAVIGTSPPLFSGLTAYVHSRLWGSSLIFEVRDLWPEVITAVGAGTENSLSYKMFDQIATLLYSKSDKIVALTDSFKESMIIDRGIDPTKIEVIENAVDTELFKPTPKDDKYISNLGAENKFIVSYVGTIGLTHGVQVVLEAAEILSEKLPDVLFLLVGDGYDKERLVNLQVKSGLNNILFLDKKPKPEIPLVLNASDICLVLSKNDDLFKKTIFAKVFEPMACGKPIIVGARGETENLVVSRARCGLYSEPENGKALADNIQKLYEDEILRDKLGENGKKFANEQFSRAIKAQQYIDVLDSLI